MVALSVAEHEWDLLKEVTIIFITSTIVWPQVNSRVANNTQVRRGGKNTKKNCTKKISMPLKIMMV